MDKEAKQQQRHALGRLVLVGHPANRTPTESYFGQKERLKIIVMCSLKERPIYQTHESGDYTSGERREKRTATERRALTDERATDVWKEPGASKCTP